MKNVACGGEIIYFIVMMKSVVEYKDYRQYILDYYSERKRSSAFTWRERLCLGVVLEACL